jgi:hypothetical protein
MKAEAAFLADQKIAPRLRSAVEKLWDKAPVRKELTPIVEGYGRGMGRGSKHEGQAQVQATVD